MKAVKRNIAEGMEKGLQITNLQNTEKMKQKGIDPAMIVECTGFSPEKMERL